MQFAPNFDPNMQSQNFGGYPNGYSPNFPGQSVYSPFISPFPNPQPFQPQAFNQGGITVNQGGFNPVSGASSPVIAGSGFNPYTKFIGNPGYGIPAQQAPQGFAPYTPFNPGFMNPYLVQQGQNQFNQQLQELLYESEPSAINATEMLEHVILTKEEREKINRNTNYIIGTDYYGRPIYANNAYQMSRQRQEEFEEARKNYQTHFVKLSKIAHAYSGEQIDEDAMMERFDPVPKQQQTNKRFNPATATEEEKQEYYRDCRYQATIELQNRIANSQAKEQYMLQQRDFAYSQIKASHDKLIGVNPGEHYDLKTFMENAYKISVDIEMKKAKSASRNGTNKYSQSNYRAGLSQATNSPIPVASKDDEIVSVEELLKGVYDRNRQAYSIMKSQEGQVSYMSSNLSPAEIEAHNRYLNSVQAKKGIDDIQRSVL